MKIKKPKDKATNISTDNIKKIDYPIFCLKHLQWNSIKKGDAKLFRSFIERIQKLEELGWENINKSDRHSFGTEQMPITSLKHKVPTFVTPDVKTLCVFRYTGNNLPFLALRNGNILHVIFIEAKFGDIYDHD